MIPHYIEKQTGLEHSFCNKMINGKASITRNNMLALAIAAGLNLDEVEKCLALLTFLPMDEVRRLGALEGQEINEAKKVLAYEVTKLVHGQEEADKAKAAAEAVFGGSGSSENMPTIELAAEGRKLLEVLVEAEVFGSKGEGRRLIQQNGLSLNDEKVTDAEYVLADSDFKDGEAIVKKGKKKFYRIIRN